MPETATNPSPDPQADRQGVPHPTLSGGATSASDGYRVRLEDFQGPLDLLLHLIRRSELDPADISIAEITDQYLTHIDEAASRIDVEVGGEFLVMAATLMEIKSRSLMPPEDRPSAARAGKHDETDPRAALISQLLAYRQFRDAAEALDARRLSWQGRYPAARAGTDKDLLREAAGADADRDLEDLDVMDLVESFAKVAAAVNFDRLGEHRIQFEDTPIELHAADILDRLSRTPPASSGAASITFRELFSGASRGEIVGLFIATLELTRQRKITVEHDAESGMISIQARDRDDDEENAIAEIPSSLGDSPADGSESS
ncbi:MAG: segregation/condensation protein A [Planctomycetota bacterium]